MTSRVRSTGYWALPVRNIFWMLSPTAPRNRTTVTPPATTAHVWRVCGSISWLRSTVTRKSHDAIDFMMEKQEKQEKKKEKEEAKEDVKSHDMKMADSWVLHSQSSCRPVAQLRLGPADGDRILGYFAH